MGLVHSPGQAPNTTDRGKSQRRLWKLLEQCLPSGETAEGRDYQRPRVLGTFLIDCRAASVPREDRLIFCNGP